MAGLPIPPEFLAQPLPPDAALMPPELAVQPQPMVIDGAMPAPVPIAPAEPQFPTATVAQGLPVPPEFGGPPLAPVAQPATPPELAFQPDVIPAAGTAEGRALRGDPRSPEQIAADRATGADPLIEATYQAGEARANKADQVAARAQDNADADLARINQDQEWETAKRAELDAAYQQHAAEVDRLAGAKVDPKRMAKEQSLFENIATAIGFLAGGALSVRNGSGRNEFQAYYQGLVDRDIAAQESELANKRAAVGMKGNLLGDLRQQFGDDRAAKAAFRAVRNEQAARQLEAYALQFDSPIMQRDMAVQAAEIRANRDKELAAATQQKFENDFKKRQLAEQVRSNKAGEQIQRDRFASEEKRYQFENEQKKRSAEKDATALEVRDIDGNLMGYAKDPIDARRVNSLVQKANEYKLLLAETKKAREKAGRRYFNSWDNEEEAQLKSNMGKLGVILKDMRQMGAWDNGTKALAEDIHGKQDGFFDRTEILDSAGAEAEAALNNELKGAGILAPDGYYPLRGTANTGGNLPAGAAPAQYRNSSREGNPALQAPRGLPPSGEPAAPEEPVINRAAKFANP